MLVSLLLVALVAVAVAVAVSVLSFLLIPQFWSIFWVDSVRRAQSHAFMF